MKINIISAMTTNRVIGQGNNLPWKNMKSDMAFFAKMTKGHIVIMGSKTYFSIPKKFRPLSDRINIVITRDFEKSKEMRDEGAIVFGSFNDAIKLFRSDTTKDVFVIGGGTVYDQAMNINSKGYLYLTRIELDAFIDDETVFFPEIPSAVLETKEILQTIQQDERNDYNAEICRYKF